MATESVARVLVAEDDRSVRESLVLALSVEGYDVEAVPDGDQALGAVAREEPDVIVLDVMMPVLDGLTVCRRLRAQRCETPILMLTARHEVSDRVSGLDAGADDYLPKPFSPAELVLRVKSILRRAGGPAGAGEPDTSVAPTVGSAGTLIRHADLTIDPDRHEVRRDDGTVIDLTRVEFRLLSAILGADGRVLSRDQLLDAVYGHEATEVLDRTIDVHIRRLRDKLDDDPDAPRYVQTVRGVGYRAARA
jgi:DNA-binding response OmpR family regulator